MARKLRPVSFNIDDDYERKLFDFAGKQKFSKYVKRLIDRDMNGTTKSNVASVPIEDLSESSIINKPKANVSSFL